MLAKAAADARCQLAVGRARQHADVAALASPRRGCLRPTSEPQARRALEAEQGMRATTCARFFFFFGIFTMNQKKKKKNRLLLLDMRFMKSINFHIIEMLSKVFFLKTKTVYRWLFGGRVWWRSPCSFSSSLVGRPRVCALLALALSYIMRYPCEEGESLVYRL
jgi:hypothetical protein